MIDAAMDIENSMDLKIGIHASITWSFGYLAGRDADLRG
jgi:hypothetical protein